MSKLEIAARQVVANGVQGPYAKYYSVPPADFEALREALAEQSEQEPVAWGRVFDGDVIDCICPEEHALNEGDYTIPLYASPVSIQNESETDSSSSSMRTTVRTKDLTDDEIREMFNGYVAPETLLMFRAVIQADREKNK